MINKCLFNSSVLLCISTPCMHLECCTCIQRKVFRKHVLVHVFIIIQFIVMKFNHVIASLVSKLHPLHLNSTHCIQTPPIVSKLYPLYPNSTHCISLLSGVQVTTDSLGTPSDLYHWHLRYHGNHRHCSLERDTSQDGSTRQLHRTRLP